MPTADFFAIAGSPCGSTLGEGRNQVLLTPGLVLFLLLQPARRGWPVAEGGATSVQQQHFLCVGTCWLVKAHLPFRKSSGPTAEAHLDSGGKLGGKLAFATRKLGPSVREVRRRGLTGTLGYGLARLPGQVRGKRSRARK